MELVLPWLDPILNPNKRVHWSKLVKPKQKHKLDAWVVAKACGKPPVRDTYHLNIMFHPPANHGYDLDNCLATIKAECDGIAEAWQVNDKQFRPITIDFGEKVKGGKIVITVSQ